MIRLILSLFIFFICYRAYTTYKPRVASYIENKKIEFTQSYGKKGEDTAEKSENGASKNNSEPKNVVESVKNVKENIDKVNSYLKKYNDFKDGINNKLKELYEKYTNK